MIFCLYKMLNRFKEAVTTVITNVTSHSDDEDDYHPTALKNIKYPYARPDFLKLNADEVQVSADHNSRPILVPRDIKRLPWDSGYAEVINAGKSRHNEDQACAGDFFVKGIPTDDENKNATSTVTNLSYYKEKLKHMNLPFDMDMIENDPLPFTYFSIFDGHAGTGAALMAVNILHNILKEKLCDIHDLLVTKHYNLHELEHRVDPSVSATGNMFTRGDPVTEDNLIVGALETAFFDMDNLIGQEKIGFKVTGGCTALVALFFMGKLYVANAGDCRAIIVREERTVITMSQDFTPITERQRLQVLGELHPELIEPEFTHLEFIRRVLRKDLGKQILHRDGRMKGWAYKTIGERDLRFPLVFGDGKRARLLATIGVTRGFGDHDLKVADTDIFIKPFLTAMPDVRIYDMAKFDHTENDVLIMGSDGLWDILSNTQAADIVRKSLQDMLPDNPVRYSSAAQELVLNARGLLQQGWQTPDKRQGSGDDITAFVIPLNRYTAGPSQSSTTESAMDSQAMGDADKHTDDDEEEDTQQTDAAQTIQPQSTKSSTQEQQTHTSMSQQ